MTSFYFVPPSLPFVAALISLRNSLSSDAVSLNNLWYNFSQFIWSWV